MLRTIAVPVVIAAAGFWCNPRPASAQESKPAVVAGEKTQELTPKGADAQSKGVQAYRLDFSLNELDDGKKVNTRHYTMNLMPGQPDTIKIGTRVPVATGPRNTNNPLVSTQFQYIDVGTRIDGHVFGPDAQPQLHVSSEISNVDSAEADQLPAPLIREIRIEGTTLLVVGKPILIGSVDDPNSKRQFQLEVMVTQLK